MPPCCGIDIEELSIKQLSHHLDARTFTSRDLTQCYLSRIQQLNPRLKAVIETNPTVLAVAEKLDGERRRGKLDAVHSLGLVFPLTPTRLPFSEQRGGVLLGKANLSEWASMRASYYAEGYSSRGGQGRNPYNLAEHSGGSSSGSASALAANMCAFSIGTETDSSIMSPADRNAVVGIKPTVGLTSTSGVIPEAPSMDTVGPFGRSVADATTVLDVIVDRMVMVSGGYGNHPERSRLPHVRVQPYASWLANKDALMGARFGLPGRRIWETTIKDAGGQYTALKELIGQMRQAGAHIHDVEFPSVEAIVSPHGWDWGYAAGEYGSKLSEFEVVKVEFYRSLKTYLGTLRNNTKNILSLEDVVAYNIEHTADEGGVLGTHPAWPTGQDNFAKCLEAKDGDETIYTKALQYIRRESRERGIDAAMELTAENGTTYQLEGLLVPLQVDGGVACSLAAKAGYPMITVPVGVDGETGVPFGLGIIQTAWNDHLLVRYGSAIEDLIGRQRPRPMFLNFDANNYTYIGNPPVS